MLTDSSLSKLPSTIGVYLFYKNKLPIYIGKSINIKARIKSHLQASKLSAKEAAIFDNSDAIKFIKTISEFDALLLEARLIKQYEPKYNVILKDDKHSLYIKISINDDFPKIYPVRREVDGRSIYFGPFQSTKTTYRLLGVLRNIIPFCMNKRIGRSACFYSKIGLCDPCPGAIQKLQGSQYIIHKRLYRRQIRLIISILTGKSRALHQQLNSEMQQAAKSKDYEQALQARRRLDSLDNLLSRRSFSSAYDELFNIDSPDVKDNFSNFMKVNFGQELNKNYKIECFDLSTLGGSDGTGSRVVFSNGEFIPSLYRRYKIKSAKNDSDVDMLREVIKRRLSDSKDELPTLMLIDGGAPQLNAIKSIMERMAPSQAYIGIAKRPDRIVFTKGKRTPYIARSDVLFKLFVSLRDEAHRFAKKYHSHLRDKKYML